MKRIDNQKLRRRIINGLLFIVFASATFYIVFKNNDINDIISNLKNADLKYIFLAIGSMFAYVFLEGVNIRRILKTSGEKISIMTTFKYSLVGFFFSSITPSSTGGQPMQLYFMNKDKVQISHGTLALLIQLLSFQFITLILALLGLIFNHSLLLNNIGNLKYLVAFGISVNIIIEAFILIMIFSKNMGKKIVDWIGTLLEKIHYKKSAEFRERTIIQLEEYQRCSKYISHNKILIVKTILTTLLQMSLYHSVPFFIYRSFGLAGYNIITFILIEAVLYISVASLPFPGSMGISEGGFMIMFKMFFPEALLGSAMVISRGISFYLFVIISFILIVILSIIDKRKMYTKPKIEQKL